MFGAKHELRGKSRYYFNLQNDKFLFAAVLEQLLTQCLKSKKKKHNIIQENKRLF